MSFPDGPYTLEDMPRLLPVFPLRGVLLLPRTPLPLNIFEPRYLAMIDDALSGERLIGMIQPEFHVGENQVMDAGKRPPLRDVGCAGRITSYAETPDGRMLVTLTGIARFTLLRELEMVRPYRSCEVDWGHGETDFKAGHGQDAVDRERLMKALKSYIEANKLDADWASLDEASNEALVNGLSMMAPFGAKEKQALLEAHDLKSRNEMLIAMTEMALAAGGSGGGGAGGGGDTDTPLQ